MLTKGNPHHISLFLMGIVLLSMILTGCANQAIPVVPTSTITASLGNNLDIDETETAESMLAPSITLGPTSTEIAQSTATIPPTETPTATPGVVKDEWVAYGSEGRVFLNQIYQPDLIVDESMADKTYNDMLKSIYVFNQFVIETEKVSDPLKAMGIKDIQSFKDYARSGKKLNLYLPRRVKFSEISQFEQGRYWRQMKSQKFNNVDLSSMKFAFMQPDDFLDATGGLGLRDKENEALNYFGNSDENWGLDNSLIVQGDNGILEFCFGTYRQSTTPKEMLGLIDGMSARDRARAAGQMLLTFKLYLKVRHPYSSMRVTYSSDLWLKDDTSLSNVTSGPFLIPEN